MRLITGMQRRFIYFPDTSPVSSAQRWFPGGRDVELHTEDGLALGAWLIPPLGADRGIGVLYAPGNGGNREGRAGLVAQLAARGFTVLSIDYRGYGGNPGEPSEEALAADARAAASLLRAEGFGMPRVIYLGESLGSAVVARLTSTDEPAGVVLRSPFTSLVDVARGLIGPLAELMPDRFPVLDLLKGTDIPVTVIRGDADEVVPDRAQCQGGCRGWQPSRGAGAARRRAQRRGDVRAGHRRSSGPAGRRSYLTPAPAIARNGSRAPGSASESRTVGSIRQTGREHGREVPVEGAARVDVLDDHDGLRLAREPETGIGPHDRLKHGGCRRHAARSSNEDGHRTATGNGSAEHASSSSPGPSSR